MENIYGSSGQNYIMILYSISDYSNHIEIEIDDILNAGLGFYLNLGKKL